jgi:capsular exopolysaccharide synthesis family protein
VEALSDPSVRRRAIPELEPAPSGLQLQPSVWLESFEHVRRGRAWVVVACLFGIVIALVLFLDAPREYPATATLELTGINEAFMNLGAVDPQAGTGNYSANTVTIATQLRILESTSLRQSVIDRLERGAPARDAIREANRTFTAKQVPGTRILTLKCTSSNPEVAAAFVNTAASEYIAQGVQFRTSTAQNTTRWLKAQVDETRVKLEAAEQRLQEFVQRSGNLFAADEEPLANTKLRQLQADVAKIQADRIQKQTRYEMAKSAPPDSLPDVIDDSTIRGYQEKIADLKREQALLLTTLTPEHYKVQRVASQLAQMEATLNEERDNVLLRIANEYGEARTRERLLTAAYANQSQAVAEQAGQAAEYGVVKREAETLRSTLNAMLQQLNQANIASALVASNVRFIDPARAVAEPTSPVLASYLTYGSGGGAGFAIGVLVITARIRRYQLRKKVLAPGHVATLLHVPELGVIPSAHVPPKNRFLSIGHNGGGEMAELVTWENKTSMLAESFRLVLTSLKSMERGGGSKVIVIASPVAGEGKTMVASNTAIAMAEAGRKTLLIDADLRKPRLDEVFGLAKDGGFCELVASEAPVTAERLRSAVRASAVPNLSVLPAGQTDTDTINRIFHMPRVSEVLDAFRAEFDIILMDTPPLLSFSDARLLSLLADGAVLVMRAGVTERDTALAARMRLVEDGVKVLGTVLNDWNPGDRAIYSNYYDYYLRERA